MLKYTKNTLPYVGTPQTQKLPAYSTYMTNATKKEKKSKHDLATTITKPTFVTEVRTQVSKPSSKDLHNKTLAGASRKEPVKSSSLATLKPKKEPESTKHEYTNVLFSIVQQQIDSYNARLQPNNKEEVDRILEGLENYPIYSLHRERTNQLKQFGIVYARLLNVLVAKRKELEKKYKGLEEVLTKLRFLNNKAPQTNTENELLKTLEKYEAELIQELWTRDQYRHILATIHGELKPMKDKAVIIKKKLEMINETLSRVIPERNADLAKQRQNKIYVKELSKEIAKVHLQNNMQIIDDAFLQMMNYELYQQAVDYKKREADEFKKKEEGEQEAVIQRKIEEKREIISRIREEIQKKAELLDKNKQAAEELAKACSGKLENLPLYRNKLDVGIYFLEQAKQEREESIKAKIKELEQLKQQKQKLWSSATDYQRQLQTKKQEVTDLDAELEEEKEKTKHCDKMLARIVLMLKRIVPILLPDKKEANVTMHNAERYLTLSGLSLEQKATILSFRNRSFPIESINEDTTLAGQPNYLRQEGVKEKVEEKGNAEEEKLELEEENFFRKAREKVKIKKFDAREKLLAIKMIEEEEKKENQKKEQEKNIFSEEEGDKMAEMEIWKQTKRDEIDRKKKERTKRFLRVQRKYSGSLYPEAKPNSKKSQIPAHQLK